jgi:hypothetical protein
MGRIAALLRLADLSGGEWDSADSADAPPYAAASSLSFRWNRKGREAAVSAAAARPARFGMSFDEMNRPGNSLEDSLESRHAIPWRLQPCAFPSVARAAVEGPAVANQAANRGGSRGRPRVLPVVKAAEGWVSALRFLEAVTSDRATNSC